MYDRRTFRRRATRGRHVLLPGPKPVGKSTLLEALGLELRRRRGGVSPEASLRHFRTRRGLDVDYVVEVGRELSAIEVKASRSVDARDMRWLAAFQERAQHVSRSLIVCLGTRRQRFREAEAVRLDEFLAELPS